MTTNEIYERANKSCIICNSCRYCEGLCAVFPAMERKREFSLKDIDYLANLCHQCSECFYDCQYAPPHEFDLAIPTQFAQVRQESYKKYAFPSFLGKAFAKNGIITSIVLVIAIFLGFLFGSNSGEANGNFYFFISEGAMIAVFGVVAVFVLIALGMSCLSFAKAIGLEKINAKAIVQSIKDVLKMRYLGGHEGEGCTYPGELRSNARRWAHHFVMYGFILCMVATSLAAFYSHVLDIKAPYEPTQLPKLLGIIGGIALCIGAVALSYLKIIADKSIVDNKSVGMDWALIGLLFIVSFTGLVLMVFRESSALGGLLYLHLSCVLALFVLVPYSKFIHVFYRFIALVKYNMDEQEA